jgi:hypothetical protein
VRASAEGGERNKGALRAGVQSRECNLPIRIVVCARSAGVHSSRSTPGPNPHHHGAHEQKGPNTVSPTLPILYSTHPDQITMLSAAAPAPQLQNRPPHVAAQHDRLARSTHVQQHRCQALPTAAAAATAAAAGLTLAFLPWSGCSQGGFYATGACSCLFPGPSSALYTTCNPCC